MSRNESAPVGAAEMMKKVHTLALGARQVVTVDPHGDQDEREPSLVQLLAELAFRLPVGHVLGSIAAYGAEMLMGTVQGETDLSKVDISKERRFLLENAPEDVRLEMLHDEFLERMGLDEEPETPPMAMPQVAVIGVRRAMEDLLGGAPDTVRH